MLKEKESLEVKLNESVKNLEESKTLIESLMTETKQKEILNERYLFTKAYLQ